MAMMMRMPVTKRSREHEQGSWIEPAGHSSDRLRQHSMDRIHHTTPVNFSA